MNTRSKAARAGWYSPRSATTQSTWPSGTPWAPLSLRPFSRPTLEKSTAVTGQPDRVAALSGGQVERPAGRQPAQLLRHELVRVHRPLELRTGVPLIPLLP